MLKALFFCLLFCIPFEVFGKYTSFTMHPVDGNSSLFSKCRLLDSVQLSYGHIDGEKFFGISGLAYDAQEKLLYMLNDRGRLFIFKIAIQNNRIASLRPLGAKRLRDIRGHKLFIRQSDSEGMALVQRDGTKRLLISFEHQIKVALFDLVGREIKDRDAIASLPLVLQDPKHYRSKNGMLESVAYSLKYGMITAPEFPLTTTKEGLHGLYTKNGLLCYLKKGTQDLAITELTMTEDEKLLVLQRGVHISRKGVGFSMQLLRIDPKQIEKGVCKSEVLLDLSPLKGWALDNFEGMTSLGKGYYLMVSDDNANPFQKTLLVLFQLDKKASPTPKKNKSAP